MTIIRKVLLYGFLLIVFMNFSIIATYGEEIKVYNNRKLVASSDQQPYLDDTGRLLVPLRMISQELGAYVVWDSAYETITITSGFPPKKIIMKIAESSAEVDGQVMEMDTKPVVSPQGRVMVPARFICDLLGVDIKWDSVNKIMQIGDTSAYAQKIPVLMYHHLLQDADIKDRNNGAILAVETFREQMDYLSRNNFYTVTLEELEKFLSGELLLPAKSILLTFDDGYQSNIIYGYPILKDYNFKAAIFVITGLEPDETQEFVPHILSHLSSAEREKTGDVFEFASHTQDLHKLDQNRKSYVVSQPQEIIISDLEFTRDKLKTTAFAYPYGQYTRKTIAILQDLGYKLAFTVKKGYTKPHDNPYQVNRFGITQSTSLEKFKSIVNLKE